MTDIKTQFLQNTPADIAKAAAIIQAGGVVAVPTETVYGLAADAGNEAAVNRIFAAKGRPNNHPLIIHIYDMSQLKQLASNIPEQCHLLAEAFWPGPLTVLLEKSSMVLDAVTGGLPTVGIRMPDHPILKALLAQGDLYVAAPSANPHKQLSPTTAQQVYNELSGKIDAVIDGGACEVGLESTIIDLTQVSQNESAKILRAGPITRAQLSLALNSPVNGYQAHEHQVPGNIEQHYQPKGTLQIVDTQQIIAALNDWPSCTACLWYSDEVLRQIRVNDTKHINKTQFVHMSATKSMYARALYDSLYKLDQNNISTIWVEKPPQTEEWADVNDRLIRASA